MRISRVAGQGLCQQIFFLVRGAGKVPDRVDQSRDCCQRGIDEEEAGCDPKEGSDDGMAHEFIRTSINDLVFRLDFDALSIKVLKMDA